MVSKALSKLLAPQGLPIALAIVMSVPVCIFGVKYVESENASISFAKKEMAGARAYRVVIPFLLHSMELSPDSLATESSLKSTFHELSLMSPGDFFSSGADAAIQEISSRSVSNPMSDKPVLLEMLDRIGDLSGLVLDPDLDSYYLMDVAVFAIPELLRALDQTGSTNRMNLAAAASAIRRIKLGVSKVIREDKNFFGVSPTLEPTLKTETARFVETLGATLWMDEGGREYRDKLGQESVKQVLSTVGRFWPVTIAELEKLLQLRIIERQKLLRSDLTLAIISWLVALSCCLAIFLVLRHQESENEIRRKKWQDEATRRNIATANSLDGTIAIDGKGIVTEFNPAAERMFGFNAAEILGKTLDESIVPLDFRSQWRTLVGTYSQTGKCDFFNRRIECIGHRKDSTLISLEIFVAAIHIVDVPTIYTASVRDLSDQKRMEMAAKNSQAILVESTRLCTLGEMAAGVAHEINNPVAVVMALAYKLRKRIGKLGIDPSDPKLVAVLADVDDVEKTNERIAKIVNGLRTFSREGSLDPIEDITVATLVAECLTLCGSRFRHAGIEVRQSVAADIRVKCRQVQISQVLVNLFSNAVDAIQDLSERWIEVAASEDQHFSIISVTDSGSGIPAEIADKILLPFFTTKGVGKGTGLGLSISQGIIDSHQGKFELDRSSTNTRFIVKLPLHPKGAKTESSLSEEQSKRA